MNLWVLIVRVVHDDFGTSILEAMKDSNYHFIDMRIIQNLNLTQKYIENLNDLDNDLKHDCRVHLRKNVIHLQFGLEIAFFKTISIVLF